MRKLMIIVAGAAALATAPLAVAIGLHNAKSVKKVAGTFTATTVSWTKTKTCTTTDGKSISITDGRYTGTALGDPDLAGPIRLAAHSVINTTDGVGFVDGRFRIDVAGRDTASNFTAVYDHGALAGFAKGQARTPYARLLANISAGFSATGGFTDGKIGNSSGGSAVEVGPGSCQPKSPVEKSSARGTISALNANSITVAALSCTIPSSMSAQVNNRFKVGDRAEIHCKLIGSDNTLVRINKRR
jgi:hypothetical protein